MKLYKTQGIIYKTIDYADNDKIVWVLSPTHGKINSIAKGVKKINSRRGSHIDLMNLCRFGFHKGSSLDSITEVTTVNTYSELKKTQSFELFYLCELIDKITVEAHEYYKFFGMIGSLLEIANTIPSEFSKLLIQFELHLLRLAGYTPELHLNIDTSQQLNPSETIYLSPYTPGYTHNTDQGMSISPRVIKAQRFCLEHNIPAILNLRLDQETQGTMRKINHIWLQNSLDMTFKSIKFLNLTKA